MKPIALRDSRENAFRELWERRFAPLKAPGGWDKSLVLSALIAEESGFRDRRKSPIDVTQKIIAKRICSSPNR